MKEEKGNPLVLCILDGVGISPRKRGNAVKLAKMPNFKKLLEKYPNTTLNAPGTAVGLPYKTMGNSEVGHITIGAGRIVNQFLRRFQLENLPQNKPLEKFIKSTNGFVHFVGFCSDGKVHSDINDAIKVAKIVIRRGKKIVWHFVSDGRDTAPKTALKYVKKLRRSLGHNVIFGSLSGRYYFDRNNNWDRSKKSFDAIFGKIRETDITIEQAIKKSYRKKITDEFIEPIHFIAPKIEKQDGIIFFNYRADRARQFLKLVIKERHKNILCFSQYGDDEINKHCPALLKEQKLKNILGDVLAKNKISQLRLAETEKYNHVTYFFDAEQMINYTNEQKILIPSPNVATYDLKPEMSAFEITEEFLKNIERFQVIIMNFANADMVGHTGNMPATIKAMQVLEKCLGKIVPAVLKLNGTILITADHGNAEKMLDWKGRPWTAHTTSKVPFIAVSNKKLRLKKLRNAGLANIAPTILKLLGIKKPIEMTESLI